LPNSLMHVNISDIPNLDKCCRSIALIKVD